MNPLIDSQEILKIIQFFSILVEEWLKKALEEDEIDEISDDFDDCSIEVIDQN